MGGRTLAGSGTHAQHTADTTLAAHPTRILQSYSCLNCLYAYLPTIFAANIIMHGRSAWHIGTLDLLKTRSERSARSANLKLLENTLYALSKAFELSRSASAQSVPDLAPLSPAAYLCLNWHSAHDHMLQIDTVAPCSCRSMHMPHLVRRDSDLGDLVHRRHDKASGRLPLISS